MKIIFTSLVMCFCFLLPAQEKGVSPVTLSTVDPPPSTTRAVVVGISDYQNEDIPDLRFADKDAEAFVAYLKSPAGGSLPDERLKVLTNQNATTAQIAAALEWLVEVSGEGDRIIIYFSGHGDVETKTMFQLGYLLTWDSPSRTYVAGAFPLSYLQAVVSTLALQNKSEVTLITDACRAGKLAGTSVGGAQITNANLSKQFANEVKILSCQPDEFSIEGEQWGGGRGVFSYHLIDGLYGLADNNSDGKVNLFEISRYLEDKVSTQADPHSQFPMTVGGRTTVMAEVNKEVLAQLKEQRAKETPVLAGIESKGFEEAILAGIDSVWQQKYQQFVAAVDARELLEAPTGQPAAYDLFLELQAANELKKLHGTMQRNLAAALQDDAQQAINAYLTANPTELAKRYAAESDYARYPRYLQKAAEILGEQNFYYPYVMAKLHYFEGLKMRLDTDNNLGGSTYQKAIEKQQQALIYQENAPYILNELGVLHTRLIHSEQAKENYEKAIALAPEWGLPYVNYCLELFYSGETEKAIEYGEKALTLLPDYPQLMNLLGWIYADRGDDSNRRNNWRRAGIELKDDFTYLIDNVLTRIEKKFRYERIIELLERAVAVDPKYVSGHINLGFCYTETDQYEKAITQYNKAIELDSSIHTVHGRLGTAYRVSGQHAKAVSAYKKAIGLLDSAKYDEISRSYISLGISYIALGKMDEALQSFLKAAEFSPFNPYAYSNARQMYEQMGMFGEAELHAIKAISLGSMPPFLFKTALLYEQLNRFEDAEWMYLKAIEAFPDFVNANNNLIALYFKTKQYKKALDHTQKLVERTPENPSAFRVAGNAAYLNNQSEQAKALFQQAVKLAPTNPSIPNQIGYFYRLHSEYEIAETYYRQALAINPQLVDVYIDVAKNSFMAGRMEAAFSWLDKGLDLQLSNQDKAYIYQYTDWLLCLAEKYDGGVIYTQLIEKEYLPVPESRMLFEKLRNKDFTNANLILNEILKKDPNNSGWNYLSCRLKIKLGETAEALSAFRKAVRGWSFHFMQNDPAIAPIRHLHEYQQIMRENFPEKYDDLDTFAFEQPEPVYFLKSCNRLAKYYEREGEYGRANILYTKAIELKSDTLNNEARLNLAEAYLKLGQLKEAMAICPEEIGSEKESDLLEAGKLFYMLGKNEAAEIHFKKYANISGSARALHNVGAFYKNHAEFYAAESFFKLGIEANPSAMIIRRSLARLYFFFDKKEAAYKVLQEAIQLQPTDLATQGVNCILSYYEHPGKPKSLFEKSGFLPIWECLELMRQNQYEQAGEAWQELQKQYNYWWLEFVKYKYLQMKIRQGETGQALQLLDGILRQGTFVNYQLYRTDQELDPLRDTAPFKALMQQYFPEKGPH